MDRRHALRRLAMVKRLEAKSKQQGLSEEEEALLASARRQITASPTSAAAKDGASADSTAVTSLVASFPTATALRRAFTGNDASGSLYVESQEHFRLGEQLRIRIEVTTPNQSLETDARVVWVNSAPSKHSGVEKGVAARLLDLSDSAERTLKDLLRKG